MAKRKRTTDVLEEYHITLENEMFCQYYTSPSEFFGNGVHSYASAYALDVNDIRQYNLAKSRASGLLTNRNILRRINDLLDSSGLNEVHVDKQLYLVLSQNADLHAKLGGIKEYNKLKGRIMDKVEHTMKMPITSINILPAPARIIDAAPEILPAPTEAPVVPEGVDEATISDIQPQDHNVESESE